MIVRNTFRSQVHNVLKDLTFTYSTTSSKGIKLSHTIHMAFTSPILPAGQRRLVASRVCARSTCRCTAAPSTAAMATSADAAVREVRAREILDSRGNPTVEVELSTRLGTFRSAVPSGASTGAHEALELRDGDKSRYGGKGVLKAVSNVNNIISSSVIGLDVRNQRTLDERLLALDGTANKATLGANAILGVSMAACAAGAAASGIPLYEHIAALAGRSAPTIMPVPVFNVINGGCHAGNTLAMQEFMVMPTGAVDFADAMRMGAETYAALRKVIKERYGLDATSVGDEGGFAPNVKDATEGLDLLVAAIENAGFTGRMKLAMDVAASEFCNSDTNMYDLDFKNPASTSRMSASELAVVYETLIHDYPVASIEDPFHEDDWSAYGALTKTVGMGTQIVGDDLTVTNVERIGRAVNEKSVNALLLKINQIGSISEAIDACNMAQNAGWGVMVSHRSGETEDTFISDLVVGLGTGQIKTGAPCRSERLAKYNQLLRIAEQLGDKAEYAGDNFRSP